MAGVSFTTRFFSELGNNTGSVLPMIFKDGSSNAVLIASYPDKKDKLEKAVEEYSTGAVWLCGIPTLKKVFDKLVYAKKKINPDIDAVRLFSKGKEQNPDTLEFALNKAGELGEQFGEQKGILEHTFKNKKLAKNLALSKFILTTAATGAALYGIVTLKQNLTKSRLKKEINKKLTARYQEKDAIEDSEVYGLFHKKEKKNVAFGGLGTFIMGNPVANTAINDCVISGTRFIKHRKGELGEVASKEFSVFAFMYALIKPIDDGINFLVKKITKKPVGLDYMALDSDVLKNAMEAEKAQKGSSKLVQQAHSLLELAGNDKKVSESATKKMVDFVFDSEHKEIGELLRKNKTIGTYKTAAGEEQLSLLTNISGKGMKKAAQNALDIIENGAKSADVAKYIRGTKIAKVAAIIANIALGAFLIGYVQPKSVLYMRKKKSGGDETNPAIKEVEIELTKEFEAKRAAKPNKKS